MCSLDVFLLLSLVATTQKNDQRVAILSVIHPVARAVVDPQLANAFTCTLPVGTSRVNAPDSAGHFKRNNVRSRSQAHEVIRPRLHHLSPLRQVLGIVVSRPHFVALAVRKLAFDCIAVPTLLIQQRADHASETVPGHRDIQVDAQR
jgi:hypothetical protein